MTDTLFDVIVELARTLGDTRTNLATGGSQTTMVDTKRNEPDDYFNEGTILILSAGGAAPEDEWGIISDWVQSTTTLTFSSLSAAVESGDRYMIVRPKYPLDVLIDKVNQVLTAERIPKIDDTSLTMTAEQLEYTLPTGIDRSNLRQVWIETNNDANKTLPIMLQNWYVESTGTTHTLFIDHRIDGSLDNRLNNFSIKLIYCPYHDPVYDPTDTIDNLIHKDRIIWPALEEILVEDLAKNTGEKYIQHRLNWLQKKVPEVKTKHPIVLPEWTVRGSGW